MGFQFSASVASAYSFPHTFFQLPSDRNDFPSNTKGFPALARSNNY
ncbi:MAG: hypothetical protein F6K41_31925 [Symploca sp. SIO3E6]|nr:hypothetical protein [Caldora sp. SIO3E6]